MTYRGQTTTELYQFRCTKVFGHVTRITSVKKLIKL